jgi:hypothetical protein
MKMLRLKSIPSSLDSCVWENVYNKLTKNTNRTLDGHPARATVHQNLCLASAIIQTG